MTHPNVRDQAAAQARPASELAVGDRIAGDFLPLGEEAEVLFTHAYSSDDDWVLVVCKAADGKPDVQFFLADRWIPVAP